MTVEKISVNISKKCSNPNLVICAACRYKASIKIKLAIKHAKFTYDKVCAPISDNAMDIDIT